MMKKTASLKTALSFALLSLGVVGGLGPASAAANAQSSTPLSTIGGSARIVTHLAYPVAAMTENSHSTSNGGLITDGPSRSECLAPDVAGSGPEALQSAITSFDQVTNTSVTCISSYLNGAPTWAKWEYPWVTLPQFGYTTWVGEAPESRELVLQVDLIPTSFKDINHPLHWEMLCASGDFDAHATQLGKSLVAAGLEHSVIRLGAEMNGSWETDYAGTTPTEQRLWVKCFQNEVTALRSAAGQHFLIDWNPVPCQANIPYTNLYPGGSFVNIMGLDLFDVSCIAPKIPYSFARLASQPDGLDSFEVFAAARHKPLSLPEWALLTIPSGDDPQFIDGIGAAFTERNFAFETYFDNPGARGGVLPLGTRTPLSLPTFQRWFGSGAKN
jgi:hypothetical protein